MNVSNNLLFHPISNNKSQEQRKRYTNLMPLPCDTLSFTSQRVNKTNSNDNLVTSPLVRKENVALQEDRERKAYYKKVINEFKFKYNSEKMVINDGVENSPVTIYRGSQAGINYGYYGKTKNGKIIYLQYANSPKMAKKKVLAGELYNLAGVCLPKSKVVKTPEGVAVQSDVNLDNRGFELSKKSVIDSIAVDAWLGCNNTLSYTIKGQSESKSYKPFAEGVLGYTKEGKRSRFNNNVNLLGNIINNDDENFQKQIKRITKLDLIDSLKKVSTIPDSSIKKIVLNSQIENKEALAETLVSRKKYISSLLSQVEQTPQNGLDIKKYIYRTTLETSNKYRYTSLDKKDKEFVDYIKDSRGMSIEQTVGFEVFKDDKTKKYIKNLVNDKNISNDDLIMINNVANNYVPISEESPENKIEIFNTMFNLKNKMGIPLQAGYLYTYAFGQDSKSNAKIDKKFMKTLETIYSKSGFKEMDYYNASLIMNQGFVDKNKVGVSKYMEDYGIDLEGRGEILSSCINDDGFVTQPSVDALNVLMGNDISPEDMSMCFHSAKLEDEFDYDIVNHCYILKDLGVKDNHDVIRLIHSAKVKESENAKPIFRDDVMSFAEGMLAEHPHTKIKDLNCLVEYMSFFPHEMTALMHSWIIKNDKIKPTDIPRMTVCILDKNNNIDAQSKKYMGRWLKKGIAPANLPGIIRVTSLEHSSLEFSQEEKLRKQKLLRDFAEDMLINKRGTQPQIGELLGGLVVPENNLSSDVDEPAVKMFSKALKNGEMDIIQAVKLNYYSKIAKNNNVSKNVKEFQETKARLLGMQMLKNGTEINTICRLCCNSKKYSDNPKDKFLHSNTEYNQDILNFVSACVDKKLDMDDIDCIVRACKIFANPQKLSNEEIDKEESSMVDFVKHLILDKNITPEDTIDLICAIQKKTRSNSESEEEVYGFDKNMKALVNDWVDSGVITPTTPRSLDFEDLLKVVISNNYNKDVVDIMKNTVKCAQDEAYINNPTYKSDIVFVSKMIEISQNSKSEFDKEKFNQNMELYKLKSENGFSADDIIVLSKLNKQGRDINSIDVNKATKLGLLSKLSYISDDSKDLIEEKVINTTDENGENRRGDLQNIIKKLLENVDISSNSIKSTTNHKEFLKNLISNKNKDKTTGLNPIETKLSTYDFTQFDEGIPLKHSREDFISNVHKSLLGLSQDEKEGVLKFHNLDLDGEIFNSIPKIKRFEPYQKEIEDKDVISLLDESSSLINGLDSSNADLFQENSNELLMSKSLKAASIPSSQIIKVVSASTDSKSGINDKVKDYLDKQAKISKFLEIAYNDESKGVPTPIFIKMVNNEKSQYDKFNKKMKSSSNAIQNEYNKFIFNNEVNVEDEELKNILDGALKGMPTVMLSVGKSQHKTHDYTVDIHTLKVLQKAIKDPEYKELSNKDRTILKYSVILHDLGKKYTDKDTPDTGHEEASAQIAVGILDQIKMPNSVKDSIVTIVKNHNWFEQYNKDKWDSGIISAKFRTMENYKIAKIISKADLSSVNSSFEYDIFDVPEEKRTSEEFDNIFKQKLVNVDKQFTFVNSESNPVFNTKILNKSKLPYDNKYNVRVLNLADDSISDDADLSKYGLNTTTKNNMRMAVHVVDSNSNFSGCLESAKIGMENTSQENVWSVSLIGPKSKRTYRDRKYGFLLDVPMSNIALAYNYNLGTGKEKNIKDFANILSSEQDERIFLRKEVTKSLAEKNINIDTKDYAEISKILMNKKHLSQLEKESMININGKNIPSNILIDAISSSNGKLLDDKCHSEMVTLNPTIQGLIAKKSNMNEVDPTFINFAKKHDLPIVLIGE